MPTSIVTTGWQPTCTHDLPPIPCTVLDCFAGAGTVGLVCEKLNRSFIGIELNAQYIELAEKRIGKAELPLLKGM